ncbi:MAG: cbb3-type cytochrome c oxidase subunit I [Pseudorhodoplanes sp.]|nr:cbb3-type cytochrome c oxidase subunit I [Pseudorhodoplanes sp.]
MPDDYSKPQPVHPAAVFAVRFTIALSVIVFLLMMLLGLAMRMAQGGLIDVPPDIFYQIMTAHGTGMVGAAGLAGAAIMWFFLHHHVRPSFSVYWLFLALFIVGVALILGGIFVGGFAGAWTFLYPLPARAGAVWGEHAAFSFVAGLLCIGVAFLLFYLDVARAIIGRYRNLANALGLPMLFGSEQTDIPPPAIVASTAVLIINTAALVVGAVILTVTAVNLYMPSFAIDPLLAKNMIYFFGHVFINATIYMAVIAVYEIIPAYTRRPWKTSKVLLAGWAATLFMALAVYPHHLFQDAVMPGWMLVMGQVLSFASGIPVIVITTYALLAYIHHSGIKWDLASALLTLGVFGWAGGIVPAVIDGMIVVNKVMHNTLWVPGHFHFYLLLGMVAMMFGFAAWLVQGEKPSPAFALSHKVAFVGFLIGGLGLVATFLYAGKESVPRRWAVHLPEWTGQDRLGSIFAVVVIIAAAIIAVRYLRRFARIS